MFYVHVSGLSRAQRVGAAAAIRKVLGLVSFTWGEVLGKCVIFISTDREPNAVEVERKIVAIMQEQNIPCIITWEKRSASRVGWGG